MSDYDKLSDQELSVLVAEKVMDWTRREDKGKTVYENKVIGHHAIFPHRLPPYASDIAAAMQVVEKMRATGQWCCIDIHSDFNYVWEVKFTRAEPYNEAHTVTAQSKVEDSLPRAICIAALQTL